MATVKSKGAALVLIQVKLARGLRADAIPGEPCAPPPMGLPRSDSLNLPDAPGDYVRG